MKKVNNFKHHILTLIGFVVLCGILLTMRFAQIGISKFVNGRNLVEYGDMEIVRSSITEARRGSIYDSDESPIAMDATSYVMYAALKGEGKVVKDPDYVASRLSQYIELSRDEILELLLIPEAFQVEFRGISPITNDVKKAIESENLDGVVLVSRTTRKYINDVYASHLIGYATPIGEDFMQAEILEGKLGLELSYDNILNGSAQHQQNVDNQIVSSVADGADIYLTLDSRIQNYLEELMTEYQQKYQPQSLNAYLVEISTGKLLAAAQRPTFNLNSREGIDAQWQNLMVEEANEPGSTVKMLTTAVAYDRKVFQPAEMFQSGSIKVYDQVVKDHNEIGWGTITFEEGFARSSNVAMVNLVNRMGDEVWVNHLQHFGFGETTNFGLINEVEGELNFDNPVSRTMSGFGQGFSATPIQLMQAFTTIGNQGKMMKIQVVNGVGVNNQYTVQELGEPITPQAAQFVLNLMVDTVEQPFGTGQPFRNPTVRVAAKTGTAQIADPNGSGYLKGPNDYYHSAVVIFPAESPKYMMYLTMKQPTTTNGRLGSQILGELFNRIVNVIMIGE